MTRILIAIILIISTLLFYWWVPILIAMICMLHFDNYYEVVIVGIMIDVLYGIKYEFFGFNLFFTLVTIIMCVTIGKVKKQILI